MQQSLSSDPIILSNLDSCNIVNKKFRFCKQYITSFQNERCLKYGSTNKLSWAICQFYLSALDSLSIAEEAAIFCAYSVTSILKLHSNRGFNLAVYLAIKKHVILLPQNSSTLLSFLISPEIALHDLIRIVWYGQRQLIDYDFGHFVQIKRQKILNV